MRCGEVAAVKVLGVLAMIDDGETDWKVLCLRVDDPLAASVRTQEDAERARTRVASVSLLRFPLAVPFSLLVLACIAAPARLAFHPCFHWSLSLAPHPVPAFTLPSSPPPSLPLIR